MAPTFASTQPALRKAVLKPCAPEALCSRSAGGVFRSLLSRFSFHRWPFALLVLLPFALCLVPLTHAYSAQVTLAWDPNTEPDLAGYKLYYKTGSSGPPYGGTGATEGDSPIDVGNVTEFTIHGLADGVTYYFVVTAYDTEGLESGYSNEVSTANDPPTFEGYPTIDYANDTIDVTYSESDMQNATTEANYSFSPSLNFATPLVEGDDITNPSGRTYRLSMASIPAYTVFTLTVSNITDAQGLPVTLSSITINDNDNDDLPDDWEVYHGVDNPDEDPDGDGLNTWQEFANSTDPNNEDTDGDSLPDGWEVTYGLDPNDDSGASGGDGDFDGDGWTNYEEYIAGTDPADDVSQPAVSPPEIVETIPHHEAGLNGDETRVPSETSFCVRIEDADGIDVTDAASVVFTINDSVWGTYTRDLGDDTVVRVVKLTDEEDTRVTKLWAVYDRYLDSYGECHYDASISVTVDVKDRRGAGGQVSYDFKVESEQEHDYAHNPDNLPDTLEVSPDDLDLEDPQYVYDAGIEVISGELKGAKIIYNSNEPMTPRFGPTDEIPSLTGASNVPMNLQPPTVYNTPVKILIPYPHSEDVSFLDVYLYNGTGWVWACDNEGGVQPGGEGWMVPGSRVDHSSGNPSTIEIKVYHFSGVQPASISSLSFSDSAAEPGGGCFIGTAAFDWNMGRGAEIALLCGFMVLLSNLILTRFLRDS